MAQNTLREAKDLLKKAAKYISKGLKKEAYTATVGGNLFAERLLKHINSYTKDPAASLADARALLQRAAHYVGKGLEMGAYSALSGVPRSQEGDLAAEKLLNNINFYTRDVLGRVTQQHAAKKYKRLQHATKKSPAQLQREIDEALAKPVTASKETSVLPPSVRVARAGLESMKEHGIKNLRYGLYRHAGDRMYQWGNFTGSPEHVITAVVPNAKNTASQDALIRALKWKR